MSARDEREARMEEEMRLHLELETQRHLEAGLSPQEARRAAILSFGGVEQMKEQARGQRRLAWVDELGRDLRFGARMLRKAPGFTAAATLTLALGIGACAAIFSVVNGVLLTPPPFPEPERMVLFEETMLGRAPDVLVSSGRFHDWLREARSFEGIAATSGGGMTLTGAGEPVRLKGLRLTGNALEVLGVRPLLGRSFAPGEVDEGFPRVCLVSHGLWQRQFGGRPDVVGQTIQLAGKPVAVIGVMPANTGMPDGNGIVDQREVEIFTPMGFSESLRREYRGHWLKVFGRLRPGVTVAEAQNEMTVIAERMARTQPLSRDWGTMVVPLMDTVVGQVRPVLLSLLGAVGFLLLIACANVASLLLARASSRAKEMAVRAALGASRSQVIRQLLVESVLLALLGAGLGLLLAKGALAALLALAPEALPRAKEIALDGRVLAFTLVLAIATGVLFGLAPVFQALGGEVHEVLKRTARGTTPGRRHGVRGALVVGEVAIALVLLAGAGLLMRSFLGLLAVNPGFDPRDALTVRVSLEDSPEGRERPAAFVQRAVEQLSALPGVRAVAAASRFPFAENTLTVPFTVTGRSPVTEGERPMADHYDVGPEYFRAMGIPLLRGRPFEPRDIEGAPRVAIISESLARRFFPGEDPLGKSIAVFGPPAEIVGVVGDVRVERLDGGISAQSYQPIAQHPSVRANFVVRTSGPAAGHAGAVRAVISRLDRDVPMYSVRTFGTLVGDSIARQRFAMTLFAVFSGVALLLAAVGIYGVTAYSVSQRTGEIGLRMALGANTGTVLRMVLGQAGRLIALGVLLGIVATLLLTRFLEGLLYNLSSQDPLTLIAVVSLLAVTAALACLVPARRASRVDPMIALRAE
jgi:putative ABC transport system permease protein